MPIMVKLKMYTSSSGIRPWSPCQFAVAGVLSSKAMIVMMTTITPSLKASSHRGSSATALAESSASLNDSLMERRGALGSVAVATKLAKEISEFVEGLGIEIVRSHGAARGDGGAHLIEVGRTVCAGSQVLLQTTAIASRERALQVVTHEFDGLLADEGVHRHSHDPPPRRLVSTSLRTRARPR